MEYFQFLFWKYEKYRIKQDQNYLSDFDELIEFSKKEEVND